MGFSGRYGGFSIGVERKTHGEWRSGDVLGLHTTWALALQEELSSPSASILGHSRFRPRGRG